MPVLSAYIGNRANGRIRGREKLAPATGAVGGIFRRRAPIREGLSRAGRPDFTIEVGVYRGSGEGRKGRKEADEASGRVPVRGLFQDRGLVHPAQGLEQDAHGIPVQ